MSGNSSGDVEYYKLSEETLKYLERTTSKKVGRLRETPPTAPEVPVKDPGPVIPEDDRVADGPE